MVQKLPFSARKAATFLVAAYVVVATYTIWAFRAWHGQSVSIMIVALAIVITMAGAMTVFGSKRMSNAVGMASELRGLAQEMKELREQQQEDEE